MISVETVASVTVLHCGLILMSLEQLKTYFQKRKKESHKLCILSTGRDLPVGLEATVCIQVYVKDGAADTAGTRDRGAEGASAGFRASTEKLIIHLLLRAAEDCRLLARGSAII